MLRSRLLYFSIAGIATLLIGGAFIFPGCLKFPFSCSNDSDCPEQEAYCDQEVCVTQVARIGWQMATFSAETRTTGNGRVEFQISVGNEPDVNVKEQPWRSLAEVRALGSLDGHYLAMRARLVSPDGWSNATLGRITVEGTNGQAEWLAAGRSTRILSVPNGLELVNGALTLQRAKLAATATITDQFDDGSIDDALWIANITNTAQLSEQSGALWIRTNQGIDTKASEVTLAPLLRGNFHVEFNQTLQQWRSSTNLKKTEFPAKTQIVISNDTNTDECIFRYEKSAPFSLTRGKHSIVTAKLNGEEVNLATVTGDATLRFSVLPGYLEESNANKSKAIAVSWDNFKASADAIVGYNRSSPEVEFETEDALLPRVKVSPESFVYANEVTVSLEATREASTIYYTLDGSNPADTSSNRQVYDHPLVLRSTTQLQAAAETSAGQMGPYTSHQYYVGTALAHAPLDNEAGSEVAETVNKWNGTAKGHVVRGVPGVIGKASHTDGEDGYLELPDSTKQKSSAYQVNSGAVAIWFKASHLDRLASIVSKDSRDYDTGGHLTASLKHGEISIRIQSLVKSFFIESLAAPLQAEKWYRLAVIFGQPQLTIMLWDENKKLVGSWSNPYSGGLGKLNCNDEKCRKKCPKDICPGNEEPFALGANTNFSEDKETTPSGGFFAGELDDFLFISLEKND